MKLYVLSFALCGVFICTGCSQQAGDAQSVSEVTSGKAEIAQANLAKIAGHATDSKQQNVLITINGQPVTKDVFDVYYSEQSSDEASVDEGQLQVKLDQLNDLIKLLVVAERAEKEQLVNPHKLALIRASALAQRYVDNFVRSYKPTDEEIKRAYDASYDGIKAHDFRASHILVEEESLAKSLIDELNTGVEFAALAKKHSLDDEAKNSGGDLGWLNSSGMPKPFVDAVGSMQVGELAKKPVKTKFGWHVIKLVDRREWPAQKLDDVYNEIRTELIQKTLDEHIDQISVDSNVVFSENAADLLGVPEASLKNR